MYSPVTHSTSSIHLYLSCSSRLPQHRDLAARNVLLDKTMTCRVGDFGLSVDLAEKDEDDSGFYAGSEGGKIPVRWTAIEAICFRQFSSASDVWSFGVLLWEIWSYAEVGGEKTWEGRWSTGVRQERMIRKTLRGYSPYRSLTVTVTPHSSFSLSLLTPHFSLYSSPPRCRTRDGTTGR